MDHSLINTKMPDFQLPKVRVYMFVSGNYNEYFGYYNEQCNETLIISGL